MNNNHNKNLSALEKPLLEDKNNQVEEDHIATQEEEEAQQLHVKAVEVKEENGLISENSRNNNEENNNIENELPTLSQITLMGRSQVESTMRTLFLPLPATSTTIGNVAGVENGNISRIASIETQYNDDNDNDMNNYNAGFLTNNDNALRDDDDEEEGEQHHQQEKRIIDFLFDPLYNRMNDHCFVKCSNPRFVKSAIEFCIIFIILQISFLTWGYEQELIMTTLYEPTDKNPSGRFPSAAFCVLINKLTATFLAGIIIICRFKCGSNNNCGLFFFCCQHHQQQETASSPPPSSWVSIRAFSPCAISNTLSSWCQYSSLRLVSYPVATVFKCSKIIPVMIMGKILHKRTRYAWDEYVEAILIGLGVSTFSLIQKKYNHEGNSEFLGYIYLFGFLICSAFTAQWQSKIYNTYGRRNVDVFQMMFGINFFGLIFTTIGLTIIHHDEYDTMIEFLRYNPSVSTTLIKAATASVVGQVCIFHYICEYGPIIFTITMTIREMLSIIISAIAFGHFISPISVLAALVVFAAVLHQIRRHYSLTRQPVILVAA